MPVNALSHLQFAVSSQQKRNRNWTRLRGNCDLFCWLLLFWLWQIQQLFDKMSCDKENIGLIECFRNRLRRLILVEPLLDRLHFIEDCDKESIRAKLNNQGNLHAADQLLNTILKGPQTEGWFRQLLDGLETVGCKHAANYINNNPPTPSMEVENDNCIRMIQLLQPTLEIMKTRDVCMSCHSKDILTDEDRDNVSPSLQAGYNLTIGYSTRRV